MGSVPEMSFSSMYKKSSLSMYWRSGGSVPLSLVALRHRMSSSLSFEISEVTEPEMRTPSR